MFCCRGSKCLGDGEDTRVITGRKIENQKLFLKQNGATVTKTNGKLNPVMFNSVPSVKRSVLRPDAKHVTNVQKDVYVKLQKVFKSHEISRTNSLTHGSYRVILIPKANTVAVPNPAPQRPAVSYTNPVLVQDHTQKPATQPLRESISLSTEFNISDEDNRTSTPYPMTTKNDGGITVSDDSALVVFDKADVESLTDEQKQVIEQLDASLNGYEETDGEIPTIIADVLPFGVTGSANEMNAGENYSPAESSSEDEPSSASSSLSNHSVNSRTGIINKKRQSLNMKKKHNSVSFQLPFDHVDKPYSPMQTASKNKNKITIVTTLFPEPQRSTPQPQESTLHVTGNDVNIWHTNNGVYVENKRQRRLSGGPFKGSFKSLFYTKYSNSDLKSYEEQTRHLTPKIMEKVASFENINDVQKSNRKPVVRSNTIR